VPEQRYANGSASGPGRRALSRLSLARSCSGRLPTMQILRTGGLIVCKILKPIIHWRNLSVVLIVTTKYSFKDSLSSFLAF
jgi:hypothetical protein